MYGKEDQSNLNDFFEEFPEIPEDESFQVQDSEDILYREHENFLFEKDIYFKSRGFNYSGYYLFDSLWLKINGEWKYFLALFDIEHDTLISYEIVDSEDAETIWSFLYVSLYHEKKISITTDLKQKSIEAINPFPMNHQLSHFHIKQEVDRKIRYYIDANNTTQAEMDDIYEVRELIFALIDSERMGDTKKLRKKLFKKKNSRNALINSLVNEIAIPHFKKLTHGIASKKVESTNVNKIEYCFKSVFTDALRRGMRSKKGVFKRFGLKLDYWEHINWELQDSYES